MARGTSRPSRAAPRRDGSTGDVPDSVRRGKTLIYRKLASPRIQSIRSTG